MGNSVRLKEKDIGESLGKYDLILDDMTFSFSNLSSFCNCKYGWYCNYIEDRDKLGNSYSDFGKFCHSILEKYAQGLLTKEQTAEHYEEYFNDEVSSLLLSPMYEKTYEQGLDYFRNLSLDLQQNSVLGVEKECFWTIGTHQFVGYIDLLLKGDDGIIILDYKSSGYPLLKNGQVKKALQDKFLGYKRQLYLYCKAVYEEYGEFPKYLSWSFIKENKVLIIPFEQSEYNEALQWAEQTINEIYNEEEFKANSSYFFCKNLCGFRGDCEYNNVGGE